MQKFQIMTKLFIIKHVATGTSVIFSIHRLLMVGLGFNNKKKGAWDPGGGVNPLYRQFHCCGRYIVHSDSILKL